MSTNMINRYRNVLSAKLLLLLLLPVRFFGASAGAGAVPGVGAGAAVVVVAAVVLLLPHICLISFDASSSLSCWLWI